ncbi:MAG TPA: ARMT1-like domain-containing protein [Dehalococcoidia bacterium]|nr:ARMT1-like domain-containing protein [Dehalococcoidia bacterium]
MKVQPECYECLAKLARDAANLASDDAQIREGAGIAALQVLENEFSPDVVSIEIATKMHDVIKKMSKNADPYRKIKNKEIRQARKLFMDVNKLYNDGFKDKLRLAVFGNSMDFFRPVEHIDATEKVQFAIDESDLLLERLKSARRVLYLADNAGEAYFDMPLYEMMCQYSDVAYVVKSRPVQNDITEEELLLAGLQGKFSKILKTGTATPGVILSQASEEFKQAFDEADLIFAKGMGYYEALHELPCEGRVFHCLKAKCRPVAKSIGVPLDSFVAMLL